MKNVLKIALSALLLTGTIGFTAIQSGSTIQSADPGGGVKPEPK